MLQFQPCGRYVLSKLAGADGVAGFTQFAKQFGCDEVNLTQIGKLGPPSCKKSVSDEGAGVRVAFHAVALDKGDAFLARLTERVPCIGGHAEHCTFDDLNIHSADDPVLPNAMARLRRSVGRDPDRVEALKGRFGGTLDARELMQKVAEVPTNKAIPPAQRRRLE